jgi:hypothetical protein
MWLISIFYYSCGLNRFEDSHIAGATAEVPGKTFLDLNQCWLRIFFEEIMRCENHAGSADTTLSAAVFKEALLDGMQALVVGEAFDGGDLSSVSLQRGDEAGVDELSVEDDRTRTAFTFAAAFFGAGEAQVFTKDVEEALYGRSLYCRRLAVDGEGDRVHAVVSLKIELATAVLGVSAFLD